MIDDLDFRDFWHAPLAEAAARSFERELSERLADALTPHAGPGRRGQIVALKTSIRRPWEAGDVVRFVAMASALHRAGALNAGYVRRLAGALLAQGRFGEAAGLFPLVEEDDHHRWWDQARALAGAGQMKQAAAAADECLGRLRGTPTQDVAAALRTLERDPSRLDWAAGWRAARSEIRAPLKAQDPAEAGTALREFLQRRTELLIEALNTIAAPEPVSWPGLRARAAACLLLGLGAEAAEYLIAAGRSASPTSVGAHGDVGSLFAAASAAASSPRQPALLQALARLVEHGAGRDLVLLAQKIMSGDARPSELATAPRPSTEIIAAVGAILGQAGCEEPAVTLFGELSAGKRRQSLRQDLAVCQSRETTRRLGFRTRAHGGARRIFDLFPYNGELELLRIKLHEMGPWVDRFVLVETGMTFSGQPKPIRFDENARMQLASFLPKIGHVVVERFPDHVTSAWAREFYQRDYAVAGLEDLCGPDDLVILSDVDEVVDRRAMDGFDGEIAPISMAALRFFLNYRLAGQEICKSILCRGRYLERWGASLLRTVLASRVIEWRIPHGGWHFSSVGDAEDIAAKLASYAHQENDRPDNERRYRGLREQLRRGELEPGWERCELGALPAYVGENRERLSHLLL